MIEVTYLDSFFSSKHSGKEMRASHDPNAFAKKLDDVSSNTDNRRQVTGKMVENPEKGEGRKVWAGERSRADHKVNQMKKTKSNIQEPNDLDQTDQEEALQSGQSLLMWIIDVPEELRDLESLSLEEPVLISEDSMKNILIWMQSLTEVDNLPEELKALAEKMTALLTDQNGLVPPGLSAEQKTELEAFLTLVNGIMEEFSAGTAAKSENREVAMQPEIAAKVISENVPADSVKSKETSVKLEVEFIKENLMVENEAVKNLTTNLSDNQSKAKGFAFQEKFDGISTKEQSSEQAIPFSLAQIETFLQQNTMTISLNQEQTQLQHNVFQQIADKIQVIHGSTQSFVSLQLAPEHLGKLTIQLISDTQQGMTAKIYAETPQAKEMIESNFGQLKDALSGKGVNLTALEVFVGQDPESSEKQREFQFQQARAQRRRGSRIDKLPNLERTALIDEIKHSTNPYVLTEGFDQLG